MSYLSVHSDQPNVPIFFINAPKEVMHLILQRLITENLPPKQVIYLALTNRTIQNIVFTNTGFWDWLFREHFPCLRLNPYSRSKTDSLTDYKQLTEQDSIIEKNIRNNKYRFSFICEGPTVGANLAAHNNIIISAGCDPTIKILDLNNGKELQTLTGSAHQFKYTLIDDDGKILFAYLGTGEIKIWDIAGGKEINTFNPQSCVTCMAIHKNQLICGTVDDKVEIWDIDSGKEIKTLDVQSSVNCMTIYNGKLIFGTHDGEVKTWEFNKTEEKPQTLRECSNPILCITVDKTGMLIFGAGNTIEIWNIEAKKQIHTLKHPISVNSLKIYHRWLFSCENDATCTINIWNTKTGERINTLGIGGSEFLKRISNITVNDGKLIYRTNTILPYDDFSALDLSQIETCDFNFPHLSPYSQQVLEDTLEILKKMVDSECNSFESIEKLAAEFHPDFRKNLQQHYLELGEPSPKKAIFRAQIEVYVQQLLHATHAEDIDKVSGILDNLISIDPKNDEIYQILCTICCQTNDNNWGKHAFHNRYGRSASFMEREKAVVQFHESLMKRWKEEKEIAPLLLDLGIHGEEECSQKLQCPPNFLPKIGICSYRDLKALSHSSDFQHLQVIPEQTTEDLRELQSRAFEKKEQVFALLGKLLTASQQKSQEIKQHPVFLGENGNTYDVANPWIAFAEKLSSIKAELDNVSRNREGLLQKFSPGSYSKLVKEVNALIDEFSTLDREHHIMRLRLYVTQWGILSVWNRLRTQGIGNLSTLLEQQEGIDIFKMGE